MALPATTCARFSRVGPVAFLGFTGAAFFGAACIASFGPSGLARDRPRSKAPSLRAVDLARWFFATLGLGWVMGRAKRTFGSGDVRRRTRASATRARRGASP